MCFVIFFRFCVVNLFVYIWNVSRGFFFCQPVPAQQRRQGGSKMTSSTCIRLHVSHVRKSLSLIQQVPDEKIQQVIEYYSAEAWNRKNQSNLCSRCRPCRSALPWDWAKCPQSPIHEHLETGCLVSIWRHMRHSPRPWAGSQQAEVCFAMILWAWSGPDMTFSVKLPGQDLIHTYIHAYRQTDRQTYIHTHISITHQTCSGKPRTCEITTQEKVHPLRITDVKITWLCTSVLLVVKGNSNNLLQSF